MGLSVLGGFDKNFTGAGATYYLPLAGQTNASVSVLASTEAAAQFDFRGLPAGHTLVLSLMRCYVQLNTQSFDCTITSRVDGADGDMEFTIPAGETGWFYAPVTGDAITAAAKFNAVLRRNASETGNLRIRNLQCCAQSFTEQGTAAATYRMLMCSNPLTLGVEDDTGPTFTREGRIVGRTGTVAIGGNAQHENRYECRTPGVFAGFHLYVTANTKTKDLDVVVWKNGAPTSVALTILAGATGWHSDFSNSFSVVAGDQVSLEYSGDCEPFSIPLSYAVTFGSTGIAISDPSDSCEIMGGGDGGAVLYTDGSGGEADSADPLGDTNLNYGTTGFTGLFAPYRGTASLLSIAYSRFGVFAAVTDLPWKAYLLINGTPAGGPLIEVPTPGAVAKDFDADLTNTVGFQRGDIIQIGIALQDPGDSDGTVGAEFSLHSVGFVITPSIVPACGIGC